MKIKISNGTVEREVIQKEFENKWAKVGYNIIENTEKLKSEKVLESTKTHSDKLTPILNFIEDDGIEKLNKVFEIESLLDDELLSIFNLLKKIGIDKIKQLLDTDVIVETGIEVTEDMEQSEHIQLEEIKTVVSVSDTTNIAESDLELLTKSELLSIITNELNLKDYDMRNTKAELIEAILNNK